MVKILEADLYKPVKKYFENLGYTVNAEVKSCDVTAYKADRLIILEMKVNFSITLLYQALDRQKICNEVFIVILKPKRRKNNLAQVRLICQKLNLGLILVFGTKNNMSLEVIIKPKLPARQKNNFRTRSVIQEINGRTMDNNIGGSTRQKIITAYTEKAIYIAYVLSKKGKTKASCLVKNYSCAADTRNILYNNYYGWFNRIGKGVYELSEKGIADLSQQKYADYLCEFQEESL